VFALALLLAGASAHVEFGSYKAQQLENEVTSFLVTGEWGGQSTAPFTTPGQLSAAAALATVATSSASTFIVSPGGNFYGDGIQGPTDSLSAQTRLNRTWDDVYNTPYPSLATLPWYTVAGQVDWAGNVSAELGFNSTNSGQWIQPDLFYTFQTVVPFSGDTIEFIMIDTLSLIGGVNAQPDVLPALYYPPPAPSGYVARAAAVAAGPAAAAATRAGAATYGAAVYGAATAAAPAAAPGAAVTYTAAMSPTISPYATAAAPTAGALGSVYGHRRAGARRMSQIANMAVAAGGMDNPRAQPYDLGYVPPEVNEAQWNWVSAAINSSYADWIIVVGNHPVWSVGEYGPTWSLVDKLAPMMEASGVALYIGGKDHSLQHFMPVPSTNNVDYIVAGNGAYGNDTTAHAGDCPYGALQFSYASGTGFVQIKISHAEANVPGLMKVTFYDDTGTSLYSFYKENPRTVAGHTIGNLGAPPSPSPLNANADSGGPMVIISGMFIVLAVSMGLWIIASHALTNMGYRGPGMRGMPGAYGLPGEKTPLVPGHGPVVNL